MVCEGRRQMCAPDKEGPILAGPISVAIVDQTVRHQDKI